MNTKPIIQPIVHSLLLGCALMSASADSYTLNLSGTFDGSDLFTVVQSQVTWTHKYWSNPTGVTFNGSSWPVQTTPQLTFGSALIPADLSGYNVFTTVSSGRDVAVAQIQGNSLLIYMADSPNGADFYNTQITLSSKPAPTASTFATLQISGVIDGSDRIRITPSQAQWIHKYWSTPTSISMNGVAWNPSSQTTLSNSGATAFLPSGVDWNTATVTSKSGRDVVTFDVQPGYTDIVFADSPNGTGSYSITIALGSVPEPSTGLMVMAGMITGASCRRRPYFRPAKCGVRGASLVTAQTR